MTLDDSKQAADGGKAKTRRGFAVMNPERQREIARLGGIAAHRSGHAHQFTTEEARAAGKKRHEPRSGPSA
jgi:general stress protein YciG